jgi:hypothetical protein
MKKKLGRDAKATSHIARVRHRFIVELCPGKMFAAGSR